MAEPSPIRLLHNRMMKETVEPWLKSQGFARQPASTWMLAGSRGDMGFIHFQQEQHNPNPSFVAINFAVLPLPWWNYLTDVGDVNGKPDWFHSFWRDRVRDPDPRRFGKAQLTWSVRIGDDPVERGEALCAHLGAVALPLLRRLSDRSEMLHFLRTGEGGGPFRRMSSPVLAIVLADDGASDELDAILATWTESGDDVRDQQREWISKRVGQASVA